MGNKELLLLLLLLELVLLLIVIGKVCVSRMCVLATYFQTWELLIANATILLTLEALRGKGGSNWPP